MISWKRYKMVAVED